MLASEEAAGSAPIFSLDYHSELLETWLMRGATLLFGTASFIGAYLLFLVQPMAGKMILPLLGGSPSVWNTAMVFFQSALLAGYLYAHLLGKLTSIKGQVLIHALVLVASFMSLPIGVLPQTSSSDLDSPIQRTLFLLSLTAGAPFLALSATAPLIQSWFSKMRHPKAGDPYFFYVASNTGSMLALLSYPFLIEPLLGLKTQSAIWCSTYAAFAVLLILCGVFTSTNLARHNSHRTTKAEKPELRAQLGWLVLSAVPSSLMLGTTQYLSTDIASIPLLWVLPLSLYLATFILGFSRLGKKVTSLATILLPVSALGIGALAFFGVHKPIGPVITAHLMTLLIAAMACHGRLAFKRPVAAHLTHYYVIIGLGGILGGLFNALLAPLLFLSVAEYPLAIAAAAVLSVFPFEKLNWKVGLRGAVTIAAMVMLFVKLRPSSGPESRDLHVERTFFGIHRVEAIRDGSSDWHRLWHGRTMHGKQYAQDPWSRTPTTYYARSGPAGNVLGVLHAREINFRSAAFVGLGTGTMAAYGRPGLALTFYEIDPAVIRIASDPKLFTYVKTSESNVTLIPGDARLELARAPDSGYDLITIDAFSSDAIPVHLITREAVELYLRKLSPDGILLFHITNWHIDLVPVIGNIAAELGLKAYLRQDGEIEKQEAILGKYVSVWAVAARDAASLGAIVADSRWVPIQRRPELRTWTDDYSDILSVMRF